VAVKALVHSRARIGRLLLAMKLKINLLTLIKIKCQAEIQQKIHILKKADFKPTSRPYSILFQMIEAKCFVRNMKGELDQQF
jgi:hypothetical protein